MRTPVYLLRMEDRLLHGRHLRFIAVEIIYCASQQSGQRRKFVSARQHPSGFPFRDGGSLHAQLNGQLVLCQLGFFPKLSYPVHLSNFSLQIE